MKTKLLSIMSLIVVAMCAMFISCSEDMGYGEKTNENVKAVVKMAKQMYESSGSVVSLPNPSANKHAVSRSAMTHLADLTPMWDEAFTHEQGHETIVIVPLQGENEIRSTVSISEGDETTYQFAKVFSRMIVKPSEGDNGIYVLSYMPESNYAATHANLESEMGYNPTDVDFTGLIVSSRLNGEVMMGFLYESGELNHYFAPATHECADHNCSENHNHEHKGLSLSFNLQNASQSNVATYSGRSEDGSDNGENTGDDSDICPKHDKPRKECGCNKFDEICIKCLNPLRECTCCPDCGKIKELCKCYELCKSCGFSTNACVCGDRLCKNCGYLPEQCICEKEKYDECPWCGVKYEKGTTHSCEKSECDVCKQSNCICNKPAPEPCKICKQTQCICEKNMTPILYTPHSGDYLVLNNMEGCVVNNTCSVFAALETACMVHGSTATQGDMYALYVGINNVTPQDPLHLDINCDFLVDYFMYTVPNDIKHVVRYGVPVIVWYNNKYVTVVGIQYDGDIIYADHENGNLYAVEENYFNGCESIVIESVFL